MTKPVTMVLIGAGNRGRGIFGRFALDMPHEARFVAVAEPDATRRRAFAETHGIPPAMQFERHEDLFSRPRLADACIVATLENVRLGPALAAMKQGYHLLIEKPVGTKPEDCARIADAAKDYDGVCMVCHQLRYTPRYAAVKSLMDSGEYGRLIAIQHSENLAYSHMAHSYVRGLFNNDRLSPMLLAKSCHDMDLFCYLTARRPARVASFGSLIWFRPEHAPAGAPNYCLEGCPAGAACPYNVRKIYFSDDTDPAFIRQIGVVKDKHELLEILRHHPFGRCVYHCDNNVVDHQTVQVEFEDAVTASFTMCGHNYHERRMTKLSLSNGEIELDFARNYLGAHTFSPRMTRELHPEGGYGTHGGGDRIILESFIEAVRTGDKRHILTPIAMSLTSHLLAFAAEEARRTGSVINLPAYEASIRAGMLRAQNDG